MIFIRIWIWDKIKIRYWIIGFGLSFGSNKRKIEGMKMSSWHGPRKNKRKIGNEYGLMGKGKAYGNGYLGLEWAKDKE